MAPAGQASPELLAAPTAIVAALAAELAGVMAALEAPRRERSPRSLQSPRQSPRSPRSARSPQSPRSPRSEDPPSAEAAQPAPRLPRPRRLQRRQAWTRATLAGEAVVVAATGDGATAAACGVEALLAAVRPRRLLVLGVAGGLTPGLASGTLMAARQVVAEDGTPAPTAPDAAWLAQAVAGGAVAGVAVAARSILGDPAAKRQLLCRAVAPASSPGGRQTAWPAATIDLESLAYARGAAAHGVPYLVVRAVLDPAEETLPLDFEACRAAGGGVSNLRVVLRALARPNRWRALWRLRGRVGAAATRLLALAQELMPLPAAGSVAAAAAGTEGGRAAAFGGASR